jgi:signal recognition particle subunit SEC65
MEYILVLIISIAIVTFVLIKQKHKNSSVEDRTLELEKNLSSKEEIINNLQSKKEVLEIRLAEFEELKTENTVIKERLKNTEDERNDIKTKNTTHENNEEARNDALRKSLEQSNTLQKSLNNEKERLNDERVQEKEQQMLDMKRLWVQHEKDVESHIRGICKDYLLKYISQEDFPYPRNKPDNTIEISDQLIIFDAKSPASDDLENFPKYIKTQTESLKKYSQHSDVKKDMYLVIPSNTLKVIHQYTYNLGDYYVFVITKDSLEPIIRSLIKIQEFESVEKLSPEDRDDICRIIGKFAHTTKRRIQIDQYFAEEFLETLKKAKTQLPEEILKSVVEFEGAEKLNPPMEKRNKKILVENLASKKIELDKEIEIRDIPEIEAIITFKDDKRDKLK